MTSYQSYRPAAHEKTRELSIAGRLSDSAWRVSAQALVDFISRPYKSSEIERALADAVQDNRFGPSGVASQRNNLKLYFAVSRLLQNHNIRQLPWSQRELDRLLDDFATKPSIREIDVDFRSVMHKLVRNGAFDHLAGLTTTIVSTQYLPGMKRLMDRRQTEHVTNRPHEFRSTSWISDHPTPSPQTATPVAKANMEIFKELPKETPKEPQKDIPKEPRKEPPREIQKEPPREIQKETQKEIPKEPQKEISKEPMQKSKEPSKRPTSPKENPVEKSKAMPQPLFIDTTKESLATTAGSPPQSITTGAIQGSSTYNDIVQEGLETLSEANMMPFVHQYELFNDVLRMLERSCFFWASRIVPTVLKKKKWTAWQQVAILEWLEYFSLPDTPLNLSPETRTFMVEKTIPMLKKMHNDTITRKALPIDAVVLIMEHAQALFAILGDAACTDIIGNIRDNLLDTESKTVETRSRLKMDFQESAQTIQQKYMQKMEDELKEKAAIMQADLENHMESCNWGLKFIAPDDEHYQGQHVSTVHPGNASGIAHSIETDASVMNLGLKIDTANANAADKSGRFVGNDPDSAKTNVSGYQPEPIGSAVSSGPSKQDIPPVGSAEYEQYWIDYQFYNKGPVPVRMVRQALSLDEKAWEDLQQAAMMIMGQNNLTDTRAKDQKPGFALAIQNLQSMRQHIFQQIKTKAFADFLCVITFKHVSRTPSLNQTHRPREQQQSAVENEFPATRDPRILAYQARAAEASSRLEALKAAPVSSVYTPPQTGHVRPPRPTIDPFFDQQLDRLFEQERGNGQVSNKRSLSPAGKRDDLSKRIKIEPLSQEDLIMLEQQPLSAGFESAARSNSFFPGRTSAPNIPDRPYSAGANTSILQAGLTS